MTDFFVQSRMVWLLEHPRVLDAISVVMFPTAFLCFNIHYWFIASYESFNYVRVPSNGQTILLGVPFEVQLHCKK
jgi:hypothetical protein